MAGLRVSEDSGKTVNKLERQGLYLSDRPEHESPSLPPDITEVSNENLMVLFGELTAWSDYACSQLALAQIDEKEAQKRLTRAEGQSLIKHYGGKTADRVAVAKANASQEPAVIKLSDDLDVAYQYRKLVEVVATTFERDAALVSRELTRRTSYDARPTKRNIN